MNQYNYPTIILSGAGALDEFARRLKANNHRRVLIVTDETLLKIGLLNPLTNALDNQGIPWAVFSETHPNPTEEDVEKGTAAYKGNNCDSIIGFGGGSPIDAAKAIRIMAVNPPPLSLYDDATGGDARIALPMPPLYAIPTTAGTGSEVGRSSVIISRETGKKAIFFHPRLIPDIAVLAPELTIGLPPRITAATGIDAFVHCLEAYLSPGFHPMADGIALAGMELIIAHLPVAVGNGSDLEAREKMLVAAAMGATAFQKGLGMIHSLAHPLSSRHGMHHGLANALLLAPAIAFLEQAELRPDQTARLDRVRELFERQGMNSGRLSENCGRFVSDLGITPGLSAHGITERDLEMLSAEAFDDPCHGGNLIPVSRNQLLSVLKAAL